MTVRSLLLSARYLSREECEAISKRTLSFATADETRVLVSSTNVATPKASWIKSGPFPFDNLGNSGTSVPIISTNKQQFFMLQQIVP